MTIFNYLKMRLVLTLFVSSLAISAFSQTVYSDYEPIDSCLVDTAACDTVAYDNGYDDLITGEKLFDLAKQYHREGKTFEMANALWQAWLAGNMDDVDRYIATFPEIKNSLKIMIALNSNSTTYDDLLEMLTTMGNDMEMCVIKELLVVKSKTKDPIEGLKMFREATSSKYKDNHFYQYISALIEYDETYNFKDVTRTFNDFKALADKGNSLAYADLAKQYWNGRAVEKDYDTALYYYIMATEAGLLTHLDAVELLFFLEENPDFRVAESFRKQLVRTDAISIDYWLNIQKRIQNLDAKD